MGMIAPNEKRLNKVDKTLLDTLPITYFLYGGINRLRIFRKLFTGWNLDNIQFDFDAGLFACITLWSNGTQFVFNRLANFQLINKGLNGCFGNSCIGSRQRL